MRRRDGVVRRDDEPAAVRSVGQPRRVPGAGGVPAPVRELGRRGDLAWRGPGGPLVVAVLGEHAPAVLGRHLAAQDLRLGRGARVVGRQQHDAAARGDDGRGVAGGVRAAVLHDPQWLPGAASVGRALHDRVDVPRVAEPVRPALGERQQVTRLRGDYRRYAERAVALGSGRVRHGDLAPGPCRLGRRRLGRCHVGGHGREQGRDPCGERRTAALVQTHASPQSGRRTSYVRGKLTVPARGVKAPAGARATPDSRRRGSRRAPEDAALMCGRIAHRGVRSTFSSIADKRHGRPVRIHALHFGRILLESAEPRVRSSPEYRIAPPGFQAVLGIVAGARRCRGPREEVPGAEEDALPDAGHQRRLTLDGARGRDLRSRALWRGPPASRCGRTVRRGTPPRTLRPVRRRRARARRSARGPRSHRWRPRRSSPGTWRRSQRCSAAVRHARG